MMKKLFLVWGIICVLFPSFVCAETDFRFRHFTMDDGLSSNMVWAILQDSRGYMWFGTDGGLNRYDGIEVKEYKFTINSRHGLDCNYISSLCEDGDRLWVGTDDGIYIYSYRTDTFTFFDKKTKSGTNIETNVYDIGKDKEGIFWIATGRQGVFKYSEKADILEQYDFADCTGFVAKIYIDHENRIWAASNQGNYGIYRLNKAKNEFEPFILKKGNSTMAAHALAIFEDSENNLWLGTWQNGLLKIDRHSGTAETYLHPSDEEGIVHIHSIMEYASHQLLIGSDDGLTLFNTVTGESKLYAPDMLKPNSLSNRFVYPICKDREGGVWIGTYYGGVNYLSPTNSQFESYVQSRFENSVKGTVIGRFCEDARGNLWIASDDGGLSCMSPTDKRFVNYMPQSGKNSLSYHNVHALCMDGDDLWIGTYAGDLNVLNTRTGVFRKYVSDKADSLTLYENSSYAIFKDREQRIWVTGMSHLNLYNREKDNFIRIKRLGGMTIDIDQDTEGNLWFATQGKGLFCFNPQKQQWKHYEYGNEPGDLPSGLVNCVTIDRNGQIWVGTMEGLCRYVPEKDSFERIPLDIPNQNICCIIEDEQTFWMTTGRGLVHYVPGEGCQVFTKSDGLQSDQFMPNAGIKTSDGKIYVGSVNGFSGFYPFQIRTNTQIPPVRITGLELFNAKVPVGDELLPVPMEYLEKLELAHDDNVISLHYAALSYCTPERNAYAYKLEGFDKEWNYVGNQTKATYTNLPAGSYVFRVKAANNDGVWNEEGASLKIVVHPPFYLTLPFKIFYVLLFCALLAYLIKLLLKRVEKKHVNVINQLTENKEKEMHEAKIQFFTVIAHEIRTPVSLIIGPLEKVLKAQLSLPESIRNDLNIIDRNSQRLLYLVNQLLDFRKVEQQGMKLKYSEQNIYQLLQSVCERFTPFITQYGATLKLECPDEEFTAMIDYEAITKVVSNLLTNASKYTRDEVTVSCSLAPDRHTFTIRVADNGVGISKEDQKKIFNPFYQAMENKPGTGIGLSIVKSVVELHNGRIEVQSELNVGSVFSVILPTEHAEGTALQEEAAGEVKKPVAAEEETLPKAQPDGKPVMLIVDDNCEMLDFLSSSFADKYTVLKAEDGVEAQEVIRRNDISLIVCDWMMPRMNGIDLCRAVRADWSTSHIPFILLTARTDTNSKVTGMDCGADVYIEKPFSVQYLMACIDNLLELRNLLRQKFSKMPLVPLNSIANNTVDNEFLTRINEIIEENFSNPELTVDFLAEQMGVSRSGLFSKVKMLANITPNELIQVIRLKKAAALLAENKYRINEICYMVGFNTPSYFAKCFQKQFGMKPGEFANRKQEEEKPV